MSTIKAVFIAVVFIAVLIGFTYSKNEKKEHDADLKETLQQTIKKKSISVKKIHSTSPPAPIVAISPPVGIKPEASRGCIQPRHLHARKPYRNNIYVDPELPNFNYLGPSDLQLKERAMKNDGIAQLHYADTLRNKARQQDLSGHIALKEMALFLGLSMQNNNAQAALGLGAIYSRQYAANKRIFPIWNIISRAMSPARYRTVGVFRIGLSINDIDETLGIVHLLIALYDLHDLVDEQYIYFPSKWINDDDLADLRLTDGLSAAGSTAQNNCLPERRILSDTTNDDIESHYRQAIDRENLSDAAMHSNFYMEAEKLSKDYFQDISVPVNGEYVLSSQKEKTFYTMRTLYMLALKRGETNAAKKLHEIYLKESPHKDQHEALIWNFIHKGKLSYSYLEKQQRKTTSFSAKESSAYWFALMYKKLYGF